MTSQTAAVQARTEDRRAGQPDLLRRYLDELGCHPLLDRAAEVRLAQRIEAGRAAAEALHDPRDLRPERRHQLEAMVREAAAARAEFTRANLRLVVSIAKRYQHRAVDLPDLIQEGNIGLMQAIDRFDWRRGYKFSTYATWWIRKAVLQAVTDASSSVRLPRHRRDQARALADAADVLERRFGRPPGARELADETGIRVTEVAAIRRASARVVSLSAPVDEDGNELADLVADPHADPDSQAIDRLLPHEIESLLSGLSPAAARVIRLRYGIGGGDPRTAAEVAAAMHVSPERVRQIEKRALASMRHRLPPLFWAS